MWSKYVGMYKLFILSPKNHLIHLFALFLQNFSGQKSFLACYIHISKTYSLLLNLELSQYSSSNTWQNILLHWLFHPLPLSTHPLVRGVFIETPSPQQPTQNWFWPQVLPLSYWMTPFANSVLYELIISVLFITILFLFLFFYIFINIYYFYIII